MCVCSIPVIPRAGPISIRFQLILCLLGSYFPELVLPACMLHLHLDKCPVYFLPLLLSWKGISEIQSGHESKWLSCLQTSVEVHWYIPEENLVYHSLTLENFSLKLQASFNSFFTLFFSPARFRPNLLCSPQCLQLIVILLVLPVFPPKEGF